MQQKHLFNTSQSTTTWEGNAKLVSDKLGGEVRVFLRIEQNKYQSNQIKGKMRLLEQARARKIFFGTILKTHQGTLNIIDDSGTIITLQVYDVHLDSQGKATFLITNWSSFSTLPAEKKECCFRFYLYPSLFHELGAFYWKENQQRVCLGTERFYENLYMHGQHGKFEMRIPFLEYRQEISSQKNFFEVLNELKSRAEKTCSFLAFCSRSAMEYFQISCKMGDQEFFSLYKQAPACSQISHTPLMEPVKTGSHKMGELLEKFNQHELHESLKQSIIYLASSYASRTLDTGYFFCFSALDRLCDSISGDIEITRSQFKRFRKMLKLEDVLDILTEKEDLGEFAENVRRKLPEFLRKPVSDQIKQMVEKLQVPTEDLWPETGFAKGIKSAMIMRNELFHQARVDNQQELYINFVKLQIFTERILLCSLGINPMDEMFKEAWEELKILNQTYTLA